MRLLPILFNTEMVRAILDGRKTVTRRIVKSPYFVQGDENDKRTLITFRTAPKGSYIFRKIGHMPYPDTPYKIGDILYVRETWQYLYELDGNEQIIEGTGRYYYAATDSIPYDTYVDSQGITHEKTSWRPSIHMPKAAARIWLEVTDVRVERIQAMNLDDFLSEGVVVRPEAFNDPENAYGQAKERFKEIWDFTVKKTDIDKYSWKANPWVWVIEFKRCEKPETEDKK